MPNSAKGLASRLWALTQEEDPQPSSPPPVPQPAGGPIVFSHQPTASPAQAMPVPLDEGLVNLMKSEAFKTPSHLTKFTDMMNALGNPSDMHPVLKAVGVVDAGITRDSILTDLKGHLTLLDRSHQGLQDQLDSQSNNTVSAAQTELAELQAKQEEARAEIARHQAESAQRATRIAQLLADQQSAKQKIESAKRRIADADASIRTPLLELQQRISAL